MEAATGVEVIIYKPRKTQVCKAECFRMAVSNGYSIDSISLGDGFYESENS